MATMVTMNREGRITLPADVRRALRLEAAAPLAVRIVKGEVVLTPLLAFPRWLGETVPPTVLARFLTAARPDAAHGVVFEGLGVEDLIALLPEDERGAALTEVARPGWPAEDPGDYDPNA